MIPDENDYESIGRRGRMYRDGVGTEKDIDKAIDCMEEAVRGGVNWAKNELFDLLLSRNSPGDIEQARNIVEAHARDGDGPAMGRLGRMYRDGVGVEKDIDKAVELMRDAVERAPWWIYDEIDTLMLSPKKDHHLKAFERCYAHPNERDPGLSSRLGRMYRDGVGVEKDIDKAIDCMEEAVRGGVNWAKNELFDLLLSRNSPGDIEQARNIVEAHARDGDGPAMGRLGRMYRDGVGVEKDIDKAVELMRDAVERAPWWRGEYNKLIDEYSNIIDSSQCTVLFYVKTSFQLLEAICIKAAYHPEEQGIIFINDYVKNNIYDVSLLEFFSLKYVVYNTSKITDVSTFSENKLVGDINVYYDILLTKHGLKLENIKEFYLFASLRFGLYLSEKGIPFNLCEDGNGAVCKFPFVLWRSGTDGVDKRALAEKYGLLDGSGVYVKALHYNQDLCPDLKTTKKSYNLNIERLLTELNGAHIKNIQMMYKPLEKYEGDDVVILLTQYYFSNVEYKTDLKKRVSLYQTICKYLLPEGKIYLKPHPADFAPYDDLPVTVLPREIPSEMLPYYFPKKYRCVATIQSSGINAFEKRAEKTILLGDNVLAMHPVMDSLHFASEMHSNIFKDYVVLYSGLYPEYIRHFFEAGGVPRCESVKEKRLILMGLNSISCSNFDLASFETRDSDVLLSFFETSHEILFPILDENLFLKKIESGNVKITTITSDEDAFKLLENL